MPGDVAHASWCQIEPSMLTCLAPQGREHDGVSNDTVKGQFLDAGGAAHASWCHTRIFFFCFLFFIFSHIPNCPKADKVIMKKPL
jgi:hypothetical protein